MLRAGATEVVDHAGPGPATAHRPGADRFSIVERGYDVDEVLDLIAGLRRQILAPEPVPAPGDLRAVELERARRRARDTLGSARREVGRRRRELARQIDLARAEREDLAVRLGALGLAAECVDRGPEAVRVAARARAAELLDAARAQNPPPGASPAPRPPLLGVADGEARALVEAAALEVEPLLAAADADAQRVIEEARAQARSARAEVTGWADALRTRTEGRVAEVEALADATREEARCVLVAAEERARAVRASARSRAEERAAQILAGGRYELDRSARAAHGLAARLRSIAQGAERLTAMVEGRPPGGT